MPTVCGPGPPRSGWQKPASQFSACALLGWQRRSREAYVTAPLPLAIPGAVHVPPLGGGAAYFTSKVA